MISVREFKEILNTHGVEVPTESVEVFRDLVEMQADLILDKWIEENEIKKPTR